MTRAQKTAAAFAYAARHAGLDPIETGAGVEVTLDGVTIVVAYTHRPMKPYVLTRPSGHRWPATPAAMALPVAVDCLLDELTRA